LPGNPVESVFVGISRSMDEVDKIVNMIVENEGLEYTIVDGKKLNRVNSSGLSDCLQDGMEDELYGRYQLKGRSAPVTVYQLLD
jgi:hypothetical protein